MSSMSQLRKRDMANSICENLESRYCCAAEMPYLPNVVEPNDGIEISLWDFDKGGEGIAYHDTTPANLGRSIRPREGVDIYERSFDDGVNLTPYVGATAPGEWLNYTIHVVKSGNYLLQFGALSEGGLVKSGAVTHLNVDGRDISGPLVEDRFQLTLNHPVKLSRGKHVVRLTFDQANPDGNCGLWSDLSITPYPHLLSPVQIQPDLSFGPGGSTLIPEPDGFTDTQKLVASGSSLYLIGSGVRRIDSNGHLDTSFGDHGFLAGDPNVSDWDVTSNGKLISVGAQELSTGAWSLTLRRYTSEGIVDTTFGTRGSVNTTYRTFSFEIQGSLVQPDGKVLVFAGIFRGPTANAAVFRFNADGTPDQTFARGYYFHVPNGDSGPTITNPKIAANGDIYLPIDSNQRRKNIHVLRLNSHGIRDQRYLVHLSRSLIDLKLEQPGSAVVVTGDENDPIQTRVTRLTGSGAIDNRFGSRGSVTVDAANLQLFASIEEDNRGRIFVLQPGGRLGDFDLSEFDKSGKLLAQKTGYLGISPGNYSQPSVSIGSSRFATIAIPDIDALDGTHYTYIARYLLR